MRLPYNSVVDAKEAGSWVMDDQGQLCAIFKMKTMKKLENWVHLNLDTKIMYTEEELKDFGKELYNMITDTSKELGNYEITGGGNFKEALEKERLLVLIERYQHVYDIINETLRNKDVEAKPDNKTMGL